MKIIRACYSPLLDMAQAIAGNIYKKMLLAKSFPVQKVIVTSEPSLTSRVVSIIKCLTDDPATHSILMVDHPGFQLVNAVNEYINGNPHPTVTWTGGKPPYRFWVSYRPTNGIASDDVLGTKIVNLAPEFLKATIGPDIYTMQGIITKNIDYYDDGWWADDGNGEFPQDEIGIVIEDNSEPPMQIFVPFTPLESDPNYDKYTGTGHSYGPDTWCLCPFEYTISSEITYGDDITFFSAPKGRIPGTETEVAGTYGVYLDAGCTQAATLTNPNAGTYLLFIQFVPNDTTHLRANVKEQTVTVAKATQGPLSVNFYTLYAIDNFYEIVGEIGFYQIFGSHPTSGNRVLMFVDPAQNAAMSFNGVAKPNQTIIVNGSVYYDYPNNPPVFYSNTTFSNLFGITETYTDTGITAFTIYQEGSANYEASASLIFTQTIYPVGFRQTHTCTGGGVGGGTIATVNFYPERHVMVGGGVGGGSIVTAQAKTHTMTGGGVGGGSITTTQIKQDQVIDDFTFHDGYNNNLTVTLQELATRNTPQYLYVIVSTSSGLYASMTASSYDTYTFHLSGTSPDNYVLGGVIYDYPIAIYVLQYTTGTINLYATQAGNAYWNAAPARTVIVASSLKTILTFVELIWYEVFTVDHHYAYCGVLLSKNVLCAVTTSSTNMYVNGSPSLISMRPYQSGTGIHFYSNTPGSYTFTVSVTANPLYADFYRTFSVTVPGAPAKKLNSVSGFPPYFIANASGSTYYNQIGGIRLASMFRSSDGGALINSYTSVTGTNKVHYLQEPIPGVQGTTTVTFTLGSTPFFGNSPKYTYSTVYMSRFDAGCTLRIQHPGNIYYYPFDATYLLKSTGAETIIPPQPPPPGTGPYWHLSPENFGCAIVNQLNIPESNALGIVRLQPIIGSIHSIPSSNLYVVFGYSNAQVPSEDGSGPAHGWNNLTAWLNSQSSNPNVTVSEVYLAYGRRYSGLFSQYFHIISAEYYY